MTYREKLQQEHPEAVNEAFMGGCDGCPKDYKYEPYLQCHLVGDDCEACWNRKIANTEEKEEKQMCNYKAGDKFVLEITEMPKAVDGMFKMAAGSDNNIYMPRPMLDTLEMLDSDYVNENFGELQEEAYQAGLNDAWEIVIKMCDYAYQSKTQRIFGKSRLGNAMKNLTPKEALAKLEAYEKEKEIKVGDVVQHKDGDLYLVITKEDDIDYDLGVIDLQTMKLDRLSGKSFALKKTGKHIDLTDLFKQIGGAKCEK